MSEGTLAADVIEIEGVIDDGVEIEIAAVWSVRMALA